MSKGSIFQEATKDLSPEIRERLLLVMTRLSLSPDSPEIILLSVAGHVMAAAHDVPKRMQDAGQDVSAEVRKALDDVRTTMVATKEAAKVEVEAGMVKAIDRLIQAAGTNIRKAEASRWILKTTLACLGGILVTLAIGGGLIWHVVNEAADMRVQAEADRLNSVVAGYKVELKARSKWAGDLTKDQYEAAQWAANLSRQELTAVKWYFSPDAALVRYIATTAKTSKDNSPFPCAGWGQQGWKIDGRDVTTCTVIIGRPEQR